MGVATRPDESPLLRLLTRAVPQIRAKLGERAAWRGIVVREPARPTAYRRVACRDELVSRDRVYRVSLHAFDQPGYAGELHDHRWPLAVLPLDPDGRAGLPLYEMPWETARDRGTLLVRSGEPWAIDRCREVRHAVSSLRPHVSVVLSDVTDPPTRENRMIIDPLDDDSVLALLGVLQRSLQLSV